MRYLMLIAGDEVAAEHVNDGCDGWSEEMAGRGVLRHCVGLRAPADATTIRVRGEELLLTDGPFAESKDQVGGLCIIECTDLDDAISVAARHPAAKFGMIELRPIVEGLTT